MPSEVHFSDSDTAAVSLKSCSTTETHSAQSNLLLYLICYCVFQKDLQAPHGQNCFTWNQTANEPSFLWLRHNSQKQRKSMINFQQTKNYTSNVKYRHFCFCSFKNGFTKKCQLKTLKVPYSTKKQQQQKRLASC